MSKSDVLRKENNKFSKDLTKENHEIYTDIVCYLRVSKLNEKEQEEVISDILRIFLDCQEQGKSIQSVIGEDYKRFADEIISAMNPRIIIFNKVKEYLKICIQAVCIMLTIDAMSIYLPQMLKGNFNLNYDCTLDMLIRFIFIFIVINFIFNYVGKNSFAFSKKQYPSWERFVFVVSIVTFFIGLIAITVIFKNVVIVSISAYYLIPIPIIYLGYIGAKKLAK